MTTLLAAHSGGNNDVGIGGRFRVPSESIITVVDEIDLQRRHSGVGDL